MQQHQHQHLLLAGLLLPLLLATRTLGLPTCPLLDPSGCCGQSCQVATCAVLHSVAGALGAAVPTSSDSSSTSTRSTADDTYGWLNRSGWQDVFTGTGSTDAALNGTTACSKYLSTVGAPGTQAPPYCSWHGISCNASGLAGSSSSGSPCPAGSTRHAVSKLELLNNRLQVRRQRATGTEQCCRCVLALLCLRMVNDGWESQQLLCKDTAARQLTRG